MRLKVLCLQETIVYHLHCFFANICHKLADKHTVIAKNIHKELAIKESEDNNGNISQ